MSVDVSPLGGSRKGGRSEQDFDLNLAPIIDCFTVLITFMLVSASFLSIGVLDASAVGSPEAVEANQAPDPVSITLSIREDHSMVFKITGKENSQLSPIRSKQELEATLSKLKGQWSTVQGITIEASNQTSTEELLSTMEASRKVFPGVALGGF